MDWPTLKERVYYEDGSLRDILIKNTSSEDWALWVNFVNNNYRIQLDGNNKTDENSSIDIDKVVASWKDLELERVSTSIFVGNTLINVHFFDPSEIENDISPAEVVTIHDHEEIVAYMSSVSKILNKQVLLTAENTGDGVLIVVNQDEVFITH